MDEVKTEREVQETIQQIQKSISTVLTSSIQYFTPFISCLLVRPASINKSTFCTSA
jgi:hypothetical protein